jgi:hypothetical protein
MEHSPRKNIYCYISHAPWRAHFVNASRWNLETFGYYILHASILGRRNLCGPI